MAIKSVATKNIRAQLKLTKAKKKKKTCNMIIFYFILFIKSCVQNKKTETNLVSLLNACYLKIHNLTEWVQT